MVFFCPHSGRDLPPPGIPSVMRYMVGLHKYSIAEFGRVHTVPTNVPGGLGYTYPNPIQLEDKLWLFWRGGGWNPTFSYTEDGREWVPARELVRSHEGQRPYAKYVGDGRRRIHAIFSDGHVSSYRNGLHYLRYEGGDLYAVGGRRLGSLKNVPLDISELDQVYRYSSSGGRAWPQDIALTGEGRPRIVYIRRTGGGDTYYFALHDGTRWQSRRIVAAGGNSAGATFDHDDPRYGYLSRQLGRWRQVEQWFTPDDGRTWSHRQLTADPSGFCVRRVTPRGLRDGNRILYVWGDDRTKSWRDFTTRVRALDF